MLNVLNDPNYPDDETIAQAQKTIAETYGINTHNGETHHIDTVGTNLERDELRDTLRVVMEELAKYPCDFFRRNTIKAMHFVKNLAKYETEDIFKGKKIWEKRHIGGRSWWKLKEILLLYYPHQKKTDHPSMRGTLHHEITHILDGHERSKLDKKWISLHEKHSRVCGTYTGKGEGPISPCFVSAYGSTSPTEERAEFAEIFMLPQRHKEFLARLANAPKEAQLVLKKKYSDMKENFLRWSGGVMNDAYWDALLKE